MIGGGHQRQLNWSADSAREISFPSQFFCRRKFFSLAYNHRLCLPSATSAPPPASTVQVLSQTTNNPATIPGYSVVRLDSATSGRSVAMAV